MRSAHRVGSSSALPMMIGASPTTSGDSAGSVGACPGRAPRSGPRRKDGTLAASCSGFSTMRLNASLPQKTQEQMRLMPERRAGRASSRTRTVK